MIDADESPFAEIAHPQQRAFVAAFQETGNVRLACQVAKVGRSTHYRWLKDDRDYREAVTVAKEVAADKLEAEAFRRAVEGVEKPVGWYKGKPGGYVREYSDILAIFLLKGLRPDVYKDRVEMRGALARIEISYLPDHLLQRVADGEHIMSVLSSAVELGAAGGVDIPKLLGAGAAGGAGAEVGARSAGAGDVREIVVEEREADGKESERVGSDG